MIVDSSAICAVIFREPDFQAYESVLVSADDAMIGAPTAAEAAIVIEHRMGGAGGGAILAALLQRFGIRVVEFEERHWPLAVTAYSRYGRGRHPAGLNFGDCLAYALAVGRDDSLLYKGQDLAQTDVRSALVE